MRLDDFSGKRSKSPETASFQLRKELIDRVDDGEKGFSARSQVRDELMALTLKAPYLVKYMEWRPRATARRQKVLTRRRENTSRNIAADYHDVFIEIWDSSHLLWNNI